MSPIADNTTINAGSGGDVIATDDLTTLNGGAVSGFKAQRVKVGWGVDGAFLDVFAGANSLPVQGGTASGNAVSGSGNPILIGGTDGTNARSLLTDTTGRAVVDASQLLTATTGAITTATTSVAVTSLSNATGVYVYFYGTYAGVTVNFEVSPDSGTTWMSLPAVPLTSVGGAGASAVTLASNASAVYYSNIAGATQFRVRASAWTSGTANVRIVPVALATPPVVGATVDTELPAAAAVADGLANATTPQLGADQLVWNGSTWDRRRGNWNTTTGDTGAKTATFNGATQVNYNAPAALITVLCGTVSGTSPTLTAQLQWSPDAGTTWLNYGPASGSVTATGNTITFLVGPNNWSVAGASPAALTTGATATVQVNGWLPRTWRLAYTIGGTSPSFAITAVYVNYLVNA